MNSETKSRCSPNPRSNFHYGGCYVAASNQGDQWQIRVLLSERCNRSAPGETIWDAGHKEAVRGFGARRQRGTPVYVVKFRALARQRFFTIGPHGSPWTPATARKEAKRLLGLVAEGKDPAAERELLALQAADTFQKIAERYLKTAKQAQRPRTYSEIERYLLGTWKPLHPLPVSQISRRHVAAHIGEVAKNDGAVTAARARSALSAMFNWAIREGLEIPSNPVIGTNRPATPRSRERTCTISGALPRP